jgi:hypothetical protein
MPILGTKVKMMPQNMTLPCAWCGAENVFRDSNQPVEVLSCGSPATVPSTCTEGSKG